jgi:hypothetical protein
MIAYTRAGEYAPMLMFRGFGRGEERTRTAEVVKSIAEE